MITRDGKVALQQWSANNIPKKVEVDKVLYEPTLRNNVILVWVNEEQLQTILDIKVKSCNCNNGATKPLFFIASDVNVAIHENGHP